MSGVRGNLAVIRARIAAAARACLRDPLAVTLVAVSKTKPATAIEEALDAGQRVFGENRVQEAIGKFATFRDAGPEIELHLIGPLQTNKVRDALTAFEVIETLDRPKLADSLAAEIAKRGPGRLRRLLIEVNTGEEPQKAGIMPLDADAFIEDCRTRLKLPVTGLMAIPPVGEEPALHFAFLREMARRHGLAELSMGMSGDYEIAIGQGATHVRIGSAIFGER